MSPPSSTLQAGTIVNSGAALDINGLGGALTLTNPLTLAGTGINNTGALRNVSGTNVVSGDVVLTNNATIGVDAGTSQLTLSGDITERVPGGFGITKVGPNRLILSGFNRYTGAVDVQQGILNIENDNALGTTNAGTTVDNGAVLEIQGGIHVGKEALTVTGSGINNTGALRNLAGDNTWAGNVTLNSNATVEGFCASAAA